jgi:(p)ppGpp synthase/HD superfamily hydrolase
MEGDKIVAVVLGKRTAVVHRDECRRIHGEKNLAEAAWLLNASRTYRIWIHVVAIKYIGMLRDVADVCAQARVVIHDVNVRSSDKEATSMSLLVEIKNTEKLSELLRKLGSLPQIQSARRGRN